MKTTCFWFVVLIALASTAAGAAPVRGNATAAHARIPDDVPLDAVIWTGGFWKQRMKNLADIHLPGVFDDMFLNPKNGACFLNFSKVANKEMGNSTHAIWGDGDCYYILDAASRVYAHERNGYLREKMDYWIPIISRCKNEKGIIDTISSLGGSGPDRGSKKVGSTHYNLGHLYKAATSHRQATGSDSFKLLADELLSTYQKTKGYINDNIPVAYTDQKGTSSLRGDRRGVRPVQR